VNGGTLVVAANGALPIGSVAINGGTLQLAQNTGVTTMSALSITGGGVLDITNDEVILTYTGSDPIASIIADIDSGYAGGKWDGPGIISSMAATNPNYGIGYADAADPGNPAGLAPGEIELRYTLLGDANLDGFVNAEDFTLYSENQGQANATWDEGDFNYDGMVNAEDFTLFAENIGQAATESGVGMGTLAVQNELDGAEVPEPGMGVILLVVGLMGMGGWRKREQARSFADYTE
jgi:hypothetical protein